MALYTGSCTINSISCTSVVQYLETVFMEKRLPIIIQNNNFWLDFVQSCNPEISLAIDTIKDKSELYVIDKMEYERLLEITELLNITFDVTVNSTTEFLRREVASIAFKLAYKATAIVYKSFYRALDRVGQVFVYYYNGQDLLRHTQSLLTGTEILNQSDTHIHLSQENFTGFLEEDRTLDSDPVQRLDTGWILDTKLSKTSTKHVGIEYVIDELVTHSSTGLSYTMTANYFDFIKSNMDVLKKATEVPHIGCQLVGIADTSNNVNTITDIELKTLTTTNYVPATFDSEVSYMKFGIGAHTDIATTIPTTLYTPIAKADVSIDEVYANTDYCGAVAEYKGQLVTVDTISTLVNPIILTYPEVRKKSIRFSFTYNFQDYTLSDEAGKFSYTLPDNEVIDADINYMTGIITFNTYPSGMTDMSILYYTKQTMEITECGVFDINDNLLAYSTFPPIEFKSNAFHVNFAFLLSKTTFS